MDIFPEDYTDITDKLPLGMHRKVPHKNCSNSACLRIGHEVEGFTFYCFKCKSTYFISAFNSPAERARKKASFDAYKEARANKSFDLPLDFSHNIPSKGLVWLGAGGWTLKLIHDYNIGWSEYLNRVIIPIVSRGCPMGYTGRAVESWQSPKYLEKTKSGAMWESKASIICTKRQSCVICEDILSAGRCGEFIKAYSILGTSLNTTQLKTFMQYSKIYLWLDPDAGGRTGVLSMINRLRLFSEVYIINSEKDPKHLTGNRIKGYLCLQK